MGRTMCTDLWLGVGVVEQRRSVRGDNIKMNRRKIGLRMEYECDYLRKVQVLYQGVSYGRN
jgi:hypothetical protein